MLLQVFVFLRQCVPKLHLTAPLRNARCEHSLHSLDVIAFPSLFAQLGPVAVSLVVVRTQRNHPVVILLRCCDLAEKAADGCTVEPEDRLGWIHTDRSRVCLGCFLMLAHGVVEGPNG